MAAIALAACGRSELETSAGEGDFGGESGSAGEGGDPGAPPANGGTSGTLSTGGVGNAGGTSTTGGLGNTGGIPSTGGLGNTGGSAQGGSSGGAGNPSTGGAPTPPILHRVNYSRPSKIDLLLMVDNSVGMVSKQRLLGQALPSLLERLTSPRCIGASGQPTGASSENGTCEEGQPEFTPIRDLHVGVISSSLGDMGSGDGCQPGVLEQDDRSWLMASVRGSLPNWDGYGFLNWDPDQRSMPAGTADFEELSAAARDHVLAAGETGCGYEASLESWYRFLIDPEPPERVERAPNDLTQAIGPSETLLTQRAAFLRPDSVVAIVMLSDENDCSIIDYGQGWVVGLQAAGTFMMPRATSACSIDPNATCCFSCSIPESSVPAECEKPVADSECQKGGYTLAEDHPNLRCFQQKRRFGFDLLQPTAKYIQGLTAPRILIPRNADRNDDGVIDARDLVPNPLYTSPDGSAKRDRSMVFLAGIVGIPWQDVSDEESWLTPRSLRYLSYDELVSEGRLDWFLGDLPRDGLMFETPLERTSLSVVPQTHPAGAGVGGTLAPSTSMDFANPINGHESNLADGSQLQTACVFELPEPVNCQNNTERCQCTTEDQDYRHAYCEGILQRYDRAFPSTRQLEVLRGFGELTSNSVITSICPKVVTAEGDPASDPDHGYQPALGALADRMTKALRSRCLSEPVAVDRNGRVDCSLLEVTTRNGDSCADCAGIPGHVAPKLDTAFLRERLGDDVCVCEIRQHVGPRLETCRTQLAEPSAGFCYVDESAGDYLDERRAVVSGCPADARQLLRLGPETADENSALYLACNEP